MFLSVRELAEKKNKYLLHTKMQKTNKKKSELLQFMDESLFVLPIVFI